MPSTDRMTLRRTNWPDVDDLVALNGDPKVMELHDDGHPMTAAQVLSGEMPRLMAHNRRTDDLGCWVARRRDDGAFLGWFIVEPVQDRADTVELSYRLRSSAWDQGFDLEGVRCMIDLARAAGMVTVVATTSAAHAHAQQTMEEAGLLAVQSTGAGQHSATAPAPIDYVLDLGKKSPSAG